MNLPYLTFTPHLRAHHQQGNVLVLFIISLLTLITMASLALDGGHLLLNKGRLQNLVDAAALHAAKELDDGATHPQARAAVVEVLNLNLAHSDLQELAQAFPLDSVDINSSQMTTQLNVEFSQRPDPFSADFDPTSHYVKVVIAQLPLNNFLAQVFGFNKQVSASAMAGPSTAAKECYKDIVPMLVCGVKDAPETDDSLFGLPKNNLFLMKTGSNDDSSIGPGNFQLIRLGDSTGGDDIRDAMAGKQFGAQDVCFSTGENNASVPTEPGNKVGPSLQGLNTRFGDHKGPVDTELYPSDTNTCQGTTIDKDASTTSLGKINDDAVIAGAYRYHCTEEGSNCNNKSHGYSPDNIAFENQNSDQCSTANDVATTGAIDASGVSLDDFLERRVVRVVIGDCSEKVNGANNLDFLGVGCFFLTQKIGNGGQNSFVVGEFFDKCSSQSKPSGEAEDNPGPYTIVLYHVPNSKDS